MARLIDADALKAKIHDTPTEGTIADYCKRVMAECLDNDAPTIPAIPVEWLEEKTRHPDAFTRGSAKWMLGCWKREQEAR